MNEDIFWSRGQVVDKKKRPIFVLFYSSKYGSNLSLKIYTHVSVVKRKVRLAW
jgi:hypothetical protein